MNRILKYVLLDIVKSRLILFYTLMLAVLAWSLFSLEDNSAKGVLSLTNVILLVVPLVTVIYSTIYLYNASEFIELLASQPLRRISIWTGFYAGLCIAMISSFLLGIGMPLVVYAAPDMAFILLLAGILITLIFVALGVLVAAIARDKARGIALAIFIWLFFAVLYDGLMLLLLFQFSDYPIEKTMIGLTAFSPVDLCRIFILLKLDVSALMGFTGALFRDFFGSALGEFIALMLMMLWVVVPFYFSQRIFKLKDL